MTATKRGRILAKLALPIRNSTEDLARIDRATRAKPIITARNDIQVLARYFECYGTGVDKLHGQVGPFLDRYTVSVLHLHEPV